MVPKCFEQPLSQQQALQQCSALFAAQHQTAPSPKSGTEQPQLHLLRGQSLEKYSASTANYHEIADFSQYRRIKPPHPTYED